MTWIVTSMKWIMLVSGALTCTMLYATLAPQAALQSVTFILLILVFGQAFLGQQAGVAVVSDLIQVSLFVAYLLFVRGRSVAVRDAAVESIRQGDQGT